MKTFQKTLFILSAIVAVLSCSYIDDDLVLKEDNPTSEMSENYQVSLKSAKYFAEHVIFDDDVERSVKSVDFIASGRDTLLFFVNFEDDKGWLVLSGDKRTEPILASSDSGQVDKNDLGGAAVWFDDIAEGIYGIKHSDIQDTSSDNYVFWSNIDALAFGIQKVADPETKALYPPAYNSDDYEDVLIDTKVEVISDKAVGPFIRTKWGQLYPWNDCTPYEYNPSTKSYERCPTGCTAVGGAQMLYYFHSFRNKPASFYSTGMCDGWVNGSSYNYSFSFSNPTSDVWSRMALSNPGIQTDGTRLVSVLMGYIGWKVGMDYSLGGSGAQTSELMNVYSEFGIQSENSGYNMSSVKSSLDKQLPVNIQAYSSRERRKFLFINIGWSYDGGHSWLIDGYKEKTIRTTYTYMRVLKPRDERGRDILKSGTRAPKRLDDDIYTTTHTSTSRYWKMNFGWDGSYDNADYSTAESSVWTTGSYGFQYEKSMVHNFSF